MKAAYSSLELKRHLNYAIKEDHISSIKPEYFSDYKDIQTVFTIIQAYYELYYSVPPSDYIINELLKIGSSISKETLKLMLTPEENISDEFIKSTFKNWIGDQLQRHDLSERIDKVRGRIVSQDYLIEAESILERDEVQQEDEDILKSTPTIPNEVFLKLPRLLKEMTINFSDVRERDIFLLAELVSLSAVFPTVSGNYDKLLLFPNLYGFVAAAAAGGKSAVIFALKSLNAFKKRMRDDFKHEMSFYNSRTKEPKPIEKFLQIGGNASAAGFISELENNGEMGGLIFETEADALTDNSKQDWGDYTTYLRKCFQHEQISVVRKDIRTNIELPKLSVLITGTPAQLIKLIPNTENGLFSRYLYYIYRKETKWRDPSKGSDVEMNFTKYAQSIDHVIYFYEDKRPVFTLSDKQWERFNEFFKKRLETLNVFNDGDIEGILFRLGTNAFRLMMILSLLRAHENQSIFSKHLNSLTCEDSDFDITLQMIDVFMKHAELIANNLSRSANVVMKKNKYEQLLDSMPTTFTRPELLTKAASMKITKPTVGRLLRRLLSCKKLIKLDRFLYQKQ